LTLDLIVRREDERTRFSQGTCRSIGTLLMGVAASAQQQKQTQTIKGEVVDLWCYMDHGARGPKHKACAAACAKLGNVYVAVGSELHQSDRERLIEKMARQVTVTGRVVSRGGMRMIYVKTIS